MSPRHIKADPGPYTKIERSDAVIMRVKLYGTDYLTYCPELVSELTRWHRYQTRACTHPALSRWGWRCPSCRYIPGGEKGRKLDKLIENPAKKIAMVHKCYDRDYVAKDPEDSVQEKDANMKRGMGGKKTSGGGKDLGRLRFVYRGAGRDDPVESGREVAFSGAVLPSDSDFTGRLRSSGGTGAGVSLGTREEKELADLRKQGLLSAGDEGTVTLASLASRDDRPVYTLRLVPKSKKRGKRKGKGLAGQASSDQSENQVGDNAELLLGNGIGETGGDTGMEPLSQEMLDAMSDHCWADFFADMEAEGWVPVVDDDLNSVAESWVVMESESEDSDEKT